MKRKKTKRYNQQNFDDWLTKIMLNLNIFFQLLEKLSFDEFVRFLRTSVTISRRTNFAKLIRKRTNLIRRNVLNDLKTSTRMFIALNDWSSLNYLFFLEVIAYFIDINWQYREVLLIFKFLKSKHTRKRLTNVVYSILKKYNLQDCLITIIANNVNNNKTLRRAFIKTLRNESII